MQQDYFDYLDQQLKPLIEPLLINVNVEQTEKNQLNKSHSASKMSRQASRVKLHLQTHLLLEASLTKTNLSGTFIGKRYCKLTMRELLVFSSKTNADLGLK